MAGCKEADDRTDGVLRPLREYSAQIKLQLVRATGPRVSLKFYYDSSFESPNWRYYYS